MSDNKDKKPEEVKTQPAKNQDEAKHNEEAQPEIGQMKRGDYMIHVFIEQARQLKCPENNTVDPIIEVSVLGEKKYTTAKDDIGSTGLAVWNEHLFFEPRSVKVEEIENAKIAVRVLDKGYFKDAVIGCYDFDVTYIYFMKQHSLMHKWIALSNPESNEFNEVTGYLKISITIAATGDEQVQITEDTRADNSDDSVLMPPCIRPEYYQLKFLFFRAENLPAMDTELLGPGSIDAFIQCKYLNQQLQTKPITGKVDKPIEINQAFYIPCQMPIMSNRIVMRLFDEDKLKSDEVVGSLLFNVKECINERNGKYFWKNIYGSPLGVTGDNTNLMNANPEVASTWKGRILMKIEAERTEKPVCVMKPLTKEDIERAQPQLQMHEYQVIAEVGQGIALPEAEKYTVMIKIANKEFKTDKPVVAENTYNRWSCRFKQQKIEFPYQDIYDIGRVYVYLMKGDKPICFYKADIEDFMNPNPKWKWIELHNDLAIGKVTEPHKAGIISIKLSIHDVVKDGPINFEQFDAWKKPPAKRLNMKKVRAYIYQCRDLPSADDDGQSDPYIVLWDSSKVPKKTATIMDNNNPMFYQTLEMSLETPSIEDMPPFILDIYDEDKISSDDFIARCIIPIKKAAYSEDNTVPRPQWHKCRVKIDAPACGEILVSFSIVEDDFSFKTPLNYMRLRDTIQFKEYQVDINILGLRDLQSVGILPVKKAFVIFNLKSLVAPDEGRALENIRTQPGPTGSNPTINTMIQFRIPLPNDPLFCPKLSCTVFDYIFKGLNQPLIGAFTIPIGELVYKLIKERQEETAAIDYILEELDKIKEGLAVSTYSLQHVTPPDTEANIGNESFARKSEQIARAALEKAKSSVKVDDEMKKPLLFKEEDNHFDQVRSNDGSVNHPTSPMRVTPRNFNNPSFAGRRPTTNALKQEHFDKFNSGMKGQLLKENEEAQEKMKREIEDQRMRDLQELKKNQAAASSKFVIMPKYELDTRLNVYREVNPPPESLYIGLGWDQDHESKVRHYRRYYPDELENIKEIMPIPSPFDQYKIFRGQSRGAGKNWWPFGKKGKQDGSGELTTEQEVGKFKGLVQVASEQDNAAYNERKADLIHNLKVKLNQLSLKKTGKPLDFKLEKLETLEGRVRFELDMENLGASHLEISKHLGDLYSDVILKRLLLRQTKCTVRVYMISAYDLASRDNGSFSDPYLIVSLGNKVYNERSNYLLDEPNPDFYKYYDFEATFPGCPPLNINVMDYDDIFGDDSVGTTSIDLEDRFFSPEWQSVKNKPIEYRQLYHPSSSVSQGVVKLWVEINPTSIPSNEIPVWNITPKPAENFEVRVCIFDTQDVIMMDMEGTSDVYCRGFFDSKEQVKETDTHYRCQNGKASFNYRLLFDLKHPRKDYRFTLQLYDRDFFKSNDIIGESVIDLRAAIMDTVLTKRPLGINKTYYNAYLQDKGAKFDYKDENTFWVPIKGRDAATGQLKDNGKVRIQIDILPKAFADQNKVGEARQEPNHSPFLPPPVGRLQFSLNPWKMFNQLVGPAMRRKVYCYCCLAFCCILFIALGPVIAGDIISALLVKATGL